MRLLLVLFLSGCALTRAEVACERRCDEWAERNGLEHPLSIPMRTECRCEATLPGTRATHSNVVPMEEPKREEAGTWL